MRRRARRRRSPISSSRTFRAVESNGGTVLTTSESVIVARPVADPPRQAGPPAPDRSPMSPAPPTTRAPPTSAPRSSLAQSRRLGLGPGYHGALPDAIRQDRLDRGEADRRRRRRTETTEYRMICARSSETHTATTSAISSCGAGPKSAMRRANWAPRRSPVTAKCSCRTKRARSTTAGKEPVGARVDASRATTPPQTAPLPDEGFARGRALEAEAQRAERFVRGDPGAPAPGPVTVTGLGSSTSSPDELVETQQFVDEFVHRGVAEPDGTGGCAFLWGHGGGGRVAARHRTRDARHRAAGHGFARVDHGARARSPTTSKRRSRRPWGITLDESPERIGTAKRSPASRTASRSRSKFQAARLEHLKAKKVQELRAAC